ncbi:methyltransferase domain-containing protein [Microbacterium esteraromaticum]|uniref:methyltransferase domain-containing protein n=1 Tax=Microbacterium esteraromaticum TaxID=57043 RepID=UPI0019D35EE6|nr:methyltransferase domain-containing protein [Microbacterium esteraromaticum]MBN7792132.1 methyltransferase domain-containing protein [Microbacterium esteraromaticum]
MAVDLRVRAVDAREQMDAADADPRMLARTYARFAAVNAVVSDPRGLYRRLVRPRARGGAFGGALRVLDIGCGGGDLALALARRLRRDGHPAQVTGIDIDPRAVEWSTRADPEGLVQWRCTSSADLVDAGEQYDIVLSNHVLHHLTESGLHALLAESRRLVRTGGVAEHSDIARSRTAYALFAAATWPVAGNVLAGSYIRADGLTSIRRSYTRAELAARVPPGWHVEKRMPARLLLRWEAPHGAP